MDYYFKPSALKDLKKLPKFLQRRIIQKLDYYIKSPKPLRFADVLKDKSLGEYRYRIGDYRIIFDLVDNKIIVLAAGHRRDIYRKS